MFNLISVYLCHGLQNVVELPYMNSFLELELLHGHKMGESVGIESDMF